LADGASGDVALRGARELVEHNGSLGPAVPLADGAAFVWHNVAERALARGEGRAAALSLLAGETRYPGVAAGGESVQILLGRAFRVDYDAARFDDAYQTAAIGVSLGPSVVTAHDRLVAAAAQREGLVDHDAGRRRRSSSTYAGSSGMLGPVRETMLPLMSPRRCGDRDWEQTALRTVSAPVELDAVR
jgi:hypothetical protein